MSRKQITWTLVIGAALLAVLVLYSKKDIRYEWSESYKVDSREPYGTWVIAELLKEHYPGKKFEITDKPLDETLSKSKDSTLLYVFIGSEILLDSAETGSLLNFVSTGHSAFLSCKEFPWELLYNLLPDTSEACYDAEYTSTLPDSKPVFNFYSGALMREEGYRFTFAIRNIPVQYQWQVFDSALYCGPDNRSLALGFMTDGYVNYARIPYGDGFFYLHTAPLAFSNYSLTDSIRLEYAASVFSFPEGGNVLWDEYNKEMDFLNMGLSESPFQYILSQRSLRWAWYVALAFLIAYLAFFMRRRHRVVPVVEAPANTSLEFVRTVGQLYFQQNNHYALAMHKIRLLKTFLRHRYFLETGDSERDLVQKISVKSQVPHTEVRTMLSNCALAERNINLNSNELIALHQCIEDFYKKCK